MNYQSKESCQNIEDVTDGADGQPGCAEATGSEFRLPEVGGRRLRTSNADFERACLVHIERLQHGIGPYDSAMLDTFCEAVRCVREYSDAMNTQNKELSNSGHPKP